MADELATHYRFVAKRIRDGMVVPFLGAGVNLAGRKKGEHFRHGEVLPDAGELAAYIADYFDYPAPADDERSRDLVRVSQYAAVVGGTEPLYDKLHEVFDADYPPTVLHSFLAEIPQLLARQPSPHYQLIVTTNYDDALERAFTEAGQPFDLVIYIADGENKGRFLHIDPEKHSTMVEIPNEYDRLSLEERSVIVKVHGAVSREKPEDDSYVITEDHYIDYLTRTDVKNLIPVRLQEKLSRSHFLFLGYSLRDWNLRAILHRIWGEKALKSQSWAVQLRPEAIDRKSWPPRNVEILDMDLVEYVDGLRSALQELDSKVTT